MEKPSLKEKAIINKQREQDGKGQSLICPVHKIRMEVVNIQATYANYACRKCSPQLFR